MAQHDIAAARLRLSIARQQQERQAAAASGSSGAGMEACGPPVWDKSAWDAFRAAHGYWPFGMQDGAQVLPPSFDGCPDWAYERMGLRKPPVSVGNPGMGTMPAQVADYLDSV